MCTDVAETIYEKQNYGHNWETCTWNEETPRETGRDDKDRAVCVTVRMEREAELDITTLP